jgi:hypothetical protein
MAERFNHKKILQEVVMPKVKLILLIFLAVSLILAPAGSRALALDPMTESEFQPERMVVDALLARPIGLLATIAGSVIFIVSSPFSALGGNIGAAWDNLVVTPARFTFQRPLGDFSEW